MKRFTWTVATLALLGGGFGLARADHLYNTFGPGDSFNMDSGESVEGISFFNGHPLTVYVAIANKFSPSETATLDLVRFAMSDAVYPGQVEAVLAADNGGQPGTTLEDLGAVSVPASSHTSNVLPSGTIYSLSSGLHPLLTAGTEYWLILQPTNPNSGMLAFWNMSTPLATAAAASTGDPAHGSWNAYSAQGAFDIQGTATTATPEPTSVTLLVVGAVGLVGYSWRHRRRPAA
jgi:hypothetical protein